MSNSPAQSEAKAIFTKALTSNYNQKIRLYCPGYDSLEAMLPPMMRDLPKDAHILTASVGTGDEILNLADKFPGWYFYAVDASMDLMKICEHNARQKGLEKRIEFHQTRLERFKPPQPADGAMITFVSQFIQGDEEKLQYFESIAANLRLGGMLVTADLVGEKATAGFMIMFNSWMASLKAGGVSNDELIAAYALKNSLRWISDSEYCSFLVQAGFSKPVRFFQSYLWSGWVSTRIK